MTSTAAPPLCRLVFSLLTTVAVAAVAGRILSAGRVYEPYLSRGSDPADTRGPWPKDRPEPMPTHGDNDRSRWDTVRALVDHGTYVIGHRDRGPSADEFHDRGIITEDGWKTIDKVLRPETQDFYSSKPPLLPTLVAGEYWLLKQLFGWSITDPVQRWWVVRTILLTVNGLPFLIYLLLLSRLAECLGTTDWGRHFVVAAAGFGTFLTTFSITLNNHTVAACSALFALYPALALWTRPEPGWRGAGLFLSAGFFAGFTACNELPAAAFAVLLFALLLWRAPLRTLKLFVPAAVVPIVALVMTNYLAIGEVVPAYTKLDSPWYKYEGSYWRKEPGQEKHGIDWAKEKEGTALYAFHLLVGHHGLFSLTPIYLLALAGMGSVLRSSTRRVPSEPGAPATGQPGTNASGLDVPGSDWVSAQRMLAHLTAALTVIVVGFYVVKSDNYGGWTSGLRWLIWLAPFWVLTMLPALDWLAERRWGRGLAHALLAVSILSASYPAWNPWRHPWIYNYLDSQGWIHY